MLSAPTVALLCFSGLLVESTTYAAPHLELEARIPLGDVRGRIDHLALDPEHGRLFVAELGNGTVGVVDLRQRRVVQRLTGFDEPQGVAWSAQHDMLYVASGGDGTVRSFRGAALDKGQVVKLGSDADNIRLDSGEQRIYVGYGSGAIAVLDSATLQRQPDLRLAGHPESFQLERNGTGLYVNVPGIPEITALNRNAPSAATHWPVKGLRANYAMALDESAGRIYSVFRHPAALGIHATKDGSLVARVPACGDADDIFLDHTRHLAYIICGEGRIDLFETQSAAYKKVASTNTASGARTGYYSEDLDRLFVAVRASGSEPAAIWVLRPRTKGER